MSKTARTLAAAGFILASALPALAQQQAGDYAMAQHGISRNRRISAMPKRWLFSGWNWTPWTLPRPIALVNSVPYVAVASASSARSHTAREPVCASSFSLSAGTDVESENAASA